MSNYSSTASASHRLPPTIFDLVAQHQAGKAKAPSMLATPVQSITGTVTTSAVSFSVDPQPAANEPIEWNADIWLADFNAALDANDSAQQDALAAIAKAAMEDAQQRGDVDRAHSISTAAAKAGNARRAAQQAAVEAMQVADHEAEYEVQGEFANLPSVAFGEGAAARTEAPATTGMPLQKAHEGGTPIVHISTAIGALSLRLGADDSPEFEAEVRAFIMEGAAEEAKELCHAKLGKIVKLTDPSNALLGLIVREFAYHAGDNGAYRVTSAKQLQQPGFKNYCRKHYGDVFGTDVDGNIVREFAGEVWWRQIGDRYRVITDDVMDPTAKPDDPNSETFNRYHVLKDTMVRPDMSATRADIKTLDEYLLYVDGGDEVTREYQLDYWAYMLQHPDVNIPVALVFISPEEGTGKSTLSYLLKWQFGPDLVSTAGGDAIYGGFHDPFVHYRITHMDEMPQPVHHGVDGLAFLYRLISEKYTSLKRIWKGASKQRTPHIVITTNRLDALKVTDTARRFCFAVNLEKPKSADYYNRLYAWIGEDAPGPGMAKLAGYLMKRDVSKWNPYARPPMTDARRYIQQASLSSEAEFIQRLIEGRDPDLIPGTGYANPFAKDMGRVTSILLGLSGYPPAITNGLRFTDKSVAKALRELGYEQVNKKATTSSDKAWCWRKFDYWESKKPRHYNAYIKDGTTPDDYPKTEASDDED
ncbi:primase-helicase family protein [Pseudomonas sp. MPC6]|uniref:primase-helicase family protein n=1 Tax=unclassified Pseudomonas TaxID=196821 RepID=UPI0011109B46|nr:primase-helicase family protein [Pseudomonas sp. MPC6]QCY11116.1 hypothetical protein ELQ88_09980 [Pseudomonas sp. MPC6]